MPGITGSIPPATHTHTPSPSAEPVGPSAAPSTCPLAYSGPTRSWEPSLYPSPHLRSSPAGSLVGLWTHRQNQTSPGPPQCLLGHPIRKREPWAEHTCSEAALGHHQGAAEDQNWVLPVISRVWVLGDWDPTKATPSVTAQGESQQKREGADGRVEGRFRSSWVGARGPVECSEGAPHPWAVCTW